MELGRPPLVVAFELSEKRKAIVADALAGASAVVYLTELEQRPAPKRCAMPARSVKRIPQKRCPSLLSRRLQEAD